MKTNYDAQFYRELVDLLYQHDPVGLAKMGAPNDEYSSEAEMIYAVIRAQPLTTIAEMRRHIFRIFQEMFDQTAGTEAAYQKVAEDVFKMIK